MAKEIYPFAYIVQGDFAGMYVYYQDYDDKYFVRSESVYKDGLFSSGLWYNASYQYKFRDIVGYEEIGSATHSADATSIIKGGLMLGVVGAMAASAAGTGTTHDTAIYFKDGKKCVFRFLNSQVHQNHITSFHQLNIKPGDPTAVPTTKIANMNTPKIESAQPAPLMNPSNPVDELITLDFEIEENSRYDLYAMSLFEDFNWLNEAYDEIGANAINSMRKYTDNFAMIKKQLESPNLGRLVLLRIDMQGSEVASIMEKAWEEDQCVGLMFGAKLRPQAQATTNTQSKPNSLNYEELKQLKELLDMGVVSQEEFDVKKKQLLGL